MADERSPGDPFAALQGRIRASRTALVEHPVYERVNSVNPLRIFMRNHAFAVLDFMSLIKALQLELTSVAVPWLPPARRLAARLVNEIVLAEESDECAPGEYMSHYELYLESMEDIGADTGPVRLLEAALRSGQAVDAALAPLKIAPTTKAFVEYTMRVCREGAVHEIAAAFLLGREDIVPQMFNRILRQLDAADVDVPRFVSRLRDLESKLPRALRGGAAPLLHRAADKVAERFGGDPRARFRRYLSRHIEIDADQHGPMAARLLRELCGEDARKWEEATVAADVALRARVALWDGVREEIDAANRLALAGWVGG